MLYPRRPVAGNPESAAASTSTVGLNSTRRWHEASTRVIACPMLFHGCPRKPRTLPNKGRVHPTEVGRIRIKVACTRAKLLGVSFKVGCVWESLGRIPTKVGGIRTKVGRVRPRVCGSLRGNDARGSVVLARSASARASSFARYGPRTGPRLDHSWACGSIGCATTSLPTASRRLSFDMGLRSQRLRRWCAIAFVNSLDVTPLP